MLTPLRLGGGQVDYDVARGWARLAVPATPPRAYTDAQLDDYHHNLPGGGRRRRTFVHAPPRHMRLRARASHAAPVGTLGFGFWNEPFSIYGSVLGTPSVNWFFYASPPSDMALAPGVRGWGWKAATLNTGRLPGLVLAPAALVAIALTRVPGLGRPVMNVARRFARAHEALLDDVALTEWHTYTLDWHAGEARFGVDGVERLRSPAPPPAPLGFVAWIDNQYAIASLDGKFGFGTRPLPEPQWLEIDQLEIGNQV
jgi:hypothetical protein